MGLAVLPVCAPRGCVEIKYSDLIVERKQSLPAVKSPDFSLLYPAAEIEQKIASIPFISLITTPLSGR